MYAWLLTLKRVAAGKLDLLVRRALLARLLSSFGCIQGLRVSRALLVVFVLPLAP